MVQESEIAPHLDNLFTRGNVTHFSVASAQERMEADEIVQFFREFVVCNWNVLVQRLGALR